MLPIAATAIREQQQQQQRKHVAIDVLLLLVVVVATVYFWSAGASDSSGTSFTRFNRQRMETRLYVTLKKKEKHVYERRKKIKRNPKILPGYRK